MLPSLNQLERVELKKVRFAEDVQCITKINVPSPNESKKSLIDDEDSPLIKHKKNKSSDYPTINRVHLPSINEILGRILKREPGRSSSRCDENNTVDRAQLNFSPIKVPPLRHKSKNSPQKHFRSSSPLKPFNDRIFQIRRYIRK